MLNFNVTGADRKRLVKALEALVGERAIYQGVPSMSFKVGPYEVTKTGEVYGGALTSEQLAALAAVGFIPETENSGEQPAGITITIQRGSLTDGDVENFTNMAASKAELIKQAFGVRELLTDVTPDTLTIHWFEDGMARNTEHAGAFITAMIDKAVQQKYVSPKPLETDNPKYSFRVFLNSLGFKGPEHKALRNDLLAGRSGSTAWRHGKPETRSGEADEAVEAEREEEAS